MLNVLHEPLDKRMYHKVGRSLLSAGHQLVSIAPQSATNAESDPPARDDIRFVFTQPASTFAARFRAAMRLVGLGRREKADVYIAPEPESWVAALCVKALVGGKVVLDMHEHIPSEFAKFFPPWMRSAVEWATLRFMRLFARYTDLIILTRESFDSMWSGLKTPRVTVINTNHLQPPCASVPAELLKAYGARPTLIHQGIFGDVRGSYQLLDAMRRIIAEMPDAVCVVLGRYVYGDVEAYRNAIREAGLQDAVILVDAVPFEDVPAWISVARVGLILFQPGPMNHTLAMPHKLFDYMREGRPVVAPDFAVEVARIVREADCGILVDTASPEAIAEAALHLLRHPDEATQLGQNGRRLVEAKYNWRMDEERLIQAMEALE